MIVVQTPSRKEVMSEHLCKFASKLKANLVKPRTKDGKSELECRCSKDGGFSKIVNNKVIYYQPELN